MSIEQISSSTSVSTPQQQTQVMAPQLKTKLHHRELSSIESLSIHQKEPSAFFTCIKKVLQILCLPFYWLYNLLFPSPSPKEVEQTTTVSMSLPQTTPENPSPTATTATPQEPAPVTAPQQITPETPALVTVQQQTTSETPAPVTIPQQINIETSTPIKAQQITVSETPIPVTIPQQTTLDTPAPVTVQQQTTLNTATPITVPQEMAPEKNDSNIFPICKAAFSLVPSRYAERIQHPNKRAAYNIFLDQTQKVLDKPIAFYKYAIENRDPLLKHCLFSMSKESSYYCEPGIMPYGSSTEEEIRWFANFADPHVMGFCEGPLLAQDEIQVLEHPVLYHVKSGLMILGHHYMRKNEIYLLKNVPCMGRLDTFSPVGNGKPPLYGNAFAQAKEAEIRQKIAHFNGMSNIFFIAAPSIHGLAGKPYQYEHLAQFFFTAYTAFYGIKKQSNNANCHVHTGNWGAGAFGNSAKVSHLMQLAAGCAAGVTLHFHPLSQREDFFAAQNLFKEIEQQHPNISIHQFLIHLEANAEKYQLFYGKSNGT